MRIDRIIVFIACVLVAGNGFAGSITFDDIGLVHGEVVTTQMPGVTIGAFNPDRTESRIAAVFDTEITGDTRDPDLQRNPPPPDPRDSWSMGNLPLDTNTGLALFIAENTEDSDEDGILDNPDDEGARPAGILVFLFENPITTFGFDLIDVEGIEAAGEVVFYHGGVVFREVLFSSLIDTDGAVYGDASINRMAPITLSQPAIKVEFLLNGSGAVDNIVFDRQIPEPSTLALLGLGLLGVGGASRLRRRRS